MGNNEVRKRCRFKKPYQIVLQPPYAPVLEDSLAEHDPKMATVGHIVRKHSSGIEDVPNGVSHEDSPANRDYDMRCKSGYWKS